MGRVSQLASLEVSGLDARVAVVTGASGGLGRHISLRLAQDGADVAVMYHNDVEAARRLEQDIAALGRRTLVIQANVADGHQVGAAVEQIFERWGRIDVLVCNAGVFSRSTIAETTDEEFDSTFAVNVKGTFNCLRAVLPLMMKARHGRVVTISSHNAKRGTGPSSKATYAATKNAIESYTKGAAVEAAPYNITVNCVSPGWVPRTAPIASHETERELKLLESIPLGRAGSPNDVAAAVAFLASEEAGYITGETLDVNGGTWMD